MTYRSGLRPGRRRRGCRRPTGRRPRRGPRRAPRGRRATAMDVGRGRRRLDLPRMRRSRTRPRPGLPPRTSIAAGPRSMDPLPRRADAARRSASHPRSLPLRLSDDDDDDLQACGHPRRRRRPRGHPRGPQGPAPGRAEVTAGSTSRPSTTRGRASTTSSTADDAEPTASTGCATATRSTWAPSASRASPTTCRCGACSCRSARASTCTSTCARSQLLDGHRGPASRPRPGRHRLPLHPREHRGRVLRPRRPVPPGHARGGRPPDRDLHARGHRARRALRVRSRAWSASSTLASATKSNALNYTAGLLGRGRRRRSRRDYPDVEVTTYHVDALAARMCSPPRTRSTSSSRATSSATS